MRIMRILSILGVGLLLLLSVATPALAGIEPVPWIVSIPANVEWFNSGVSITSGQTFSIVASGSWATDSLTCEASGMGSVAGALFIMPNVSAYSLIGKIDNGAPFYVGPNYSGTTDATGILYLSMNDTPGMFGDNSGSITATILVQPFLPSPVPGVTFWGIMAMTLFFGSGMVCMVWKRLISGGSR